MGQIITEIFKDYLLTLSSTNLSISELNTDKQVQLIELDEIRNLNLIQIIPIGNHILIFDLDERKLIYINENWETYQVFFSSRLASGKFIVTQQENNNLLLFNSMSYYEFDLLSKTLNEVSGIDILKHNSNFWYVSRDVVDLKRNILYYNEQERKVLYHFHNDKKVYFDNEDTDIPYYFHDDGGISRIGIYDVNLNQKQLEFSAPERIFFGGWFGWTEDSWTPNQSVIKSLFTTDKIILCYPETIYVLNLEGKILQKHVSSEGKRYTNINLLNDNELVISEFSAIDQIAEIGSIRIF